MNVKIEEQHLRFKISEEELTTLLAGHCLHVKTGLLDKALVVTVNPQGRGKNMEPKLVLDQKDAYLNLLVPPSCVQKLFDLGKNRDGLVQEINGVSITFQVDMKDACHR